MKAPDSRHRFHGRAAQCVACLALLLWLRPACAAGVRQLSVTHNDGEFVVAAELSLRTSQEGVFRVLADYGGWHRLNPSIISSRIVSIRDGHRLIHSQTRACLLFYCREISQTQDVTEIDHREVIAVTLPEAGNLRRGFVHWCVEPDGGNARVLLFARLAPDFWIPPVIGPWSIRVALRREVLETASNLERLAASMAPAPVPATGAIRQ